MPHAVQDTRHVTACNSCVMPCGCAEGLKKQRLPTVREIAGEALQQALREKMKEGVMEALRPLEQSLGAVERTLGVVERRLGAVDERLDGLAKIVVAGSNRAARMHNRTTGIACGQLQQLHKERRLKPTAAVSAADGFGSLPPQGVFPPTMEALHGEVGSGLGACCQDTSGWLPMENFIRVALPSAASAGVQPARPQDNALLQP